MKYNVPARLAASAISIPVTTTPSFEGHRITSYGGYVTSKIAIELSDWAFGNGDFDMDQVIARIERIEFIEIDKLKIAAAQLDCNAVVGLEFKHITLDRDFIGLVRRDVNRSFVIVSAVGTAVTIEPE